MAPLREIKRESSESDADQPPVLQLEVLIFEKKKTPKNPFNSNLLYQLVLFNYFCYYLLMSLRRNICISFTKESL